MAGAFCVFGISRSICKAAADKKTPTSDAKTKLELSMEEWAKLRDEIADDLFSTATRRVRVSPELDAPQFCRDWLAADPSNVRDAVLMVRGPKLDKKGDVIMRNGVPAETWHEYEAECARLGIEQSNVELAPA